MKIAVIYNKSDISQDDVINFFGIRNKEFYSNKIVEKVAASLEAEGHNVRVIDGNKDVISKLQNFMPKVIMGEFPGMVFNMAYGIQGQSRYTHIPAMLEMMGVPYVGSGPAAHGIALDKVMTKIVFQRFNLPTPEYNVINGYDYDVNALEFPVIVKPRNESVSMGMKVVYNAEELKAAVDELLDNHIAVFVERFIPGREFAVGLLGNEPNLEILPVVEIGLDSPDAIQTYDHKTKSPMGKICPPDLPADKMEEIKLLARKAFNSLGLCDYARVDFRMDSEGNFYLLEINSMASLGLTGSYFNSATVAGYTYSGLINKILDNASLRYFGSSYQKNPEISGNITDNKLNKTARIRRYIRSQMGTIESYLEKFVAVSSNAYNAEGVNFLNRNLEKILTQLGFNSTIYPQTEVGDMYYFKNHTEEKDDILLLAHSDTISDYQSHINIFNEQNKIFGSGIAESKSGLAILVIALKSLKFVKSLKKRKIGILLMSDDTIGGHFSRDLVKMHSQNALKIVGLKNGNPDGSYTSSCSGKLKFRIDYSIIEKGNLLLKQYLQFINKISKLPELHNVQVRVDKSDYNYVSESNIYKSTIKFTIAFDSMEMKELIEKKVREYAKPSSSLNINYNVKRLLNRKPLLSANRNEDFCNEIENLSKKLEITIAASHRPTSSNICNIVDAVPAIEGMGALGGNLRTGKEYILKDSLIDRAVLLSLLLDNLGE